MESGKHLRGPSEQSICLLIFTIHMPFRFSGGFSVHLRFVLLLSSSRSHLSFFSLLSPSWPLFRWTDRSTRFHSCLSHWGRQRCRYPSSLSVPLSLLVAPALAIPMSVHVSSLPFLTPFFFPFLIIFFYSPHLIHTPFLSSPHSW